MILCLQCVLNHLIFNVIFDSRLKFLYTDLNENTFNLDLSVGWLVMTLALNSFKRIALSFHCCCLCRVLFLSEVIACARCYKIPFSFFFCSFFSSSYFRILSVNCRTSLQRQWIQCDARDKYQDKAWKGNKTREKSYVLHTTQSIAPCLPRESFASFAILKK